MAHQKIIDSVKKQGQVTIKDLDEFLRFVINEYDMRTLNNNYICQQTVRGAHQEVPSRRGSARRWFFAEQDCEILQRV